MSDIIETSLFLTIPHVQCFTISKNLRELQIEDDLKILISQVPLSLLKESPEYSSYNFSASSPEIILVYTIILGDSISIALHPHTLIIRLSPYNYIFPHDNFDYALLFKNIHSTQIEILENILKSHTTFITAPSSSSSKNILDFNEKEDKIANMGMTIASGVNKGAKYLSKQINLGTQKIGAKITSSANYLKTDSKSADVKVSDKTKNVLKKVETVSNTTYQVSHTLLSVIFSTAAVIAGSFTESVQSRKIGSRFSHSKKTKAAKSIIINTIGACSVLSDIGNAALFLTTHTAKNISDVLRNRYGQDVGDSSETVLNSVLNTGRVVVDVKNMGVKTIAKHVAKDTTIGLCDSTGSEENSTENSTVENDTGLNENDFQESKNNNSNDIIKIKSDENGIETDSLQTKTTQDELP